MNKIIDISDSAADLRIQNHKLIVDIPSMKRKLEIPMFHIAVILITHPAVTFSEAVFRELASHGGILIICERNYMPCGIFTPLNGNCLQSRRIAIQINSPVPRKKKAWQQVVQAKIQAQADVLQKVTGADAGLRMISKNVRSGDTGNVEGMATQRYWKRLFGQENFRRTPESQDPINTALNSGYAILRSVVTRAICAAGLHPSIGIHHKNQYNPFCLADDLMEPFRPVVDYEIASSLDLYLKDGVTIETKKRLINAASTIKNSGKNAGSFFYVATQYVSSFVQYLEGTKDEFLHKVHSLKWMNHQ